MGQSDYGVTRQTRGFLARTGRQQDSSKYQYERYHRTIMEGAAVKDI